MLGATLFVMVCSARNRLRRRLQRLKEPRYLLGALVGTAYLYFAILGRAGRGRRRLRGTDAVPLAFFPWFDGAGPTLAGLAMLALAVICLPMPFASGLFEFTKAETEILFPAPVSRRELLVYRLVRSQWAVVFSALIMALTYPLASVGARVRGFAGAWLLLMVCHVFFTGVSLTRRPPLTPTRRTRLIAVMPRLLVGVAAIVVVAEAWLLMRTQPIASAPAAVGLLTEAGATGLSQIVLWPFVAVTSPLFAESWPAFVLALPAALGIYGLLIAWVLNADASFAAAAEAMVEEREVAAAKPKTSYRVRGAGWNLALHGRPETAFLWKGALQTFRVVSRRFLVRVIFIVAWLVFAVTMLEGRARGLVQALGILTAALAAFTTLFGPQVVRVDLRQDLQRLDLLKTWPIRGAAVVRGQMLWPGLVVTVVACSIGVIALILSASAFSPRGMQFRTAIGAAALIVAPGLVFAQFTIHNAAALMFPAWVTAGAGRPRGVDAMGQRLIMLTGTWLVLALSLLPAALIGAVLWFLFYRLVGVWVLPIAALVGVSITAAEVLLASELLGAVYDRLDLSSVEAAE